MNYCKKLIRDKLVNKIRNGQIKIANNIEYEELLLEKILEEAKELYESKNLEEAADLYEVLITWLRLKGFTEDSLKELASRKRRELGGFTKGYVLLYEC